MSSWRQVLIGLVPLLLVTQLSAEAKTFLECKTLVQKVLSNDHEVLRAQQRLRTACMQKTQSSIAADAAVTPCTSHNLPSAVADDREVMDAAEQLRDAELRATSRAKQVYYRLQHAYAAQELIRAQQGRLRDLLRVAEANYSAGKALQQDVLKSQVEISLMETRATEAELELHATESEINAMVGQKSLGEPVPAPPKETPHVLSLTIEKLGAKEDSTRSGACEAKPTTTPKMIHKPDGARPCDDSQKGLALEIRQLYLKAKAAEKLVDLYERTILPQSRFAAYSSLVSYEDGNTNFLNVLTSSTLAFEASMHCSEQNEELSLALVRLEELTGMELLD